MLATLIREDNPCLTIPPEIKDRDEEDLLAAYRFVKSLLRYMPKEDVKSFIENWGA